MTIKRDNEIYLQMADNNNESPFDDSILFDYDTGRLGQEEEHSTSSLNSSLGMSLSVGDVFERSIDLEAIQELQKRINDIVLSRQVSTTADSATTSRRPQRAAQRNRSSDFLRNSDNEGFGYDSLVLNRERTALIRNVRPRRFMRIEPEIQDDQEPGYSNYSYPLYSGDDAFFSSCVDSTGNDSSANVDPRFGNASQEQRGTDTLWK